MTTKRCSCRHPEQDHHLTDAGQRCLPTGVEGCNCEGFTQLATPGEPLVFGVHRLSREEAAAAPAWAPPGEHE